MQIVWYFSYVEVLGIDKIPTFYQLKEDKGFVYDLVNLKSKDSQTSTAQIPSFNIMTLLKPDTNFNSRAFASLVKHNKQYHLFYAARSSYDRRYALFKRSAYTIHGLVVASEELILSPKVIQADMVWMPYIIKKDDKFYIFFTVRRGSISSRGEFDEFVMLMTSNDLVDFDIIENPIVQPELEWEGSEIENWGIIKVGEDYYMSLESRGPTQTQEARSIGYAISKDFLNWERVGKQPSITGGVCCSSFFVYKKEFYSIAAAGNRFAIHKAESILKLQDENLIGYFYPHGRTYQGSVDTAEVVTATSEKIVQKGQDFLLMFSSATNVGWYTHMISFATPDVFLSSLYLD